MLNAIIRFSIRNKLVVGLLVLALVGWGGWSVTQLPIDAVPDITNNQVQVITASPSLGAPDIERLVTFPVEVSLRNIPGLIEIRSFSRFGLSIVTVVFTDATDVYWARQQIAERLQTVATQIPPGVGQPVLGPVTTGLGEIFQYSVVAKPGYESRYSLMELRTLQDWVIRRGLLGTPGVADVSGFGGDRKQYEIAADPDKLRALNLTISDLFAALERNNQNTGGAYIDKKPNAYFIRSEGLLGSTSDISNVLIKLNTNGLPIRISDVARVGMGSAVRYGAVTRNGTSEVVGAVVMMLKGENSSAVIQRVKAKIDEISRTLPDGVAIVPFLDRTKMVNSAIGTVTRNLTEGAIIVIFVLVLLLGNWRAGLVVASVIPLALLFAIALMNVFGVSGNLMSLGAIDFGLIVDGAVIIVEATLHHIQLVNGRMSELATEPVDTEANRVDTQERMAENKTEQPNIHSVDQSPIHSAKHSLIGTPNRHTFTQSQMDSEVFNAAARIRSSAAFGEIIILIVYLPILALSGVEGKMFRPMALTVGFAILGAFILSLTYVPMMSALFLDKRVQHRRTFSDRLMGRLQRIYAPVLGWSLRHRMAVLAVAVGLLAIGGWLFSGLGGEFLPTLDEGDFAVDTRTLTGSSLSETVDATLKAEKLLLKKFPEVEQVVGKIGSGDVPTDPMSIEASDLMVILKPRDQWTSATSRDELASKMAAVLTDVPGVTFGFQQPVQMRFNELMTGARQDVGVKIYGDDLNELTRLANQVGHIIRGIDGASDLYIEPVTGIEQLLIQLDRPQLARYGLNVTDVNRTINTALAGQAAGQVYEGEKRFDLVVRLEASKRQSMDDIKNLFVSTPDGRQLPLTQIAQVTMQSAPNQIQRDDTHRRITLGFNVRQGRDVQSIVAELEAKVTHDVRLPPGYLVSYGGQFQNLVEAKQRLGIAVPVALLLIFSLLFFTFSSFKQSLLIFMAIPLAAIGGVFALVLRGMPFSISAGVGFIALFGVAVLNGIVLIAEFNRLRHEEGLTDLFEIVRKGTEIRLRPVIMTALVASLGFIPMAISNSAGAEVQKPLATVVIGGLITATLLTLLVLPILYTFFEKINTKHKAKSAPVIAMLSVLLCLVGTLPAWAQPPATRLLSLEQALTEANQRNAQLQIATLGIEQQQALRPTAFEIGRTTVNATLGQANSIRFDNNLVVSQTIPNPGLLRRQGQLIDASVANRQAARLVTQNEVRYQVRAAYYDLNYYDQRGRLFRQQDSVLVEFVQAAALRVRAGEAGSLEKATAETQRADQRVRLTRNAADREAIRTQLQTLLQSPDRIDAPDAGLPRLMLVIPTDSLALARNPMLAQLAQQVVVAEQVRQVEQARLRPDFSVGLFSQTLVGPQTIDGLNREFGLGNRFWGGHIGLSLPLQTGPQKARINAARIGEQLARTEQTTRQTALDQQLSLAIRQYEAYRTALTDYEQTAVPQAQLIQTNARRAFRGGDIGYVEFSLAIQQALIIRQSHLDLLNLYNQSVLTINYLVGE